MEQVINHANRGGYVLGVCNGFQILTEAGLLPGALLRNKEQKFVCKNIYIKPITNNSLLTSALDLNKAYKIPVAHGEGRYYIEQNGLAELKQNDQVLFHYCDENGNCDDISNFNGSLENIAGVTNKARNVFGMMPHPERATDEILGNTDGRAIFESILNLVK
jgi:phosphoribosylformylglycinamidine synthase subunit PurQ / glutaminase